MYQVCSRLLAIILALAVLMPAIAVQSQETGDEDEPFLYYRAGFQDGLAGQKHGPGPGASQAEQDAYDHGFQDGFELSIDIDMAGGPGAAGGNGAEGTGQGDDPTDGGGGDDGP